MSADRGSLSCFLIGQNLISLILRVSFKLKKFAIAFSHSVTSLRFDKQDRVRKYRFGIFLFKVELGIVEINVLQTRNPIPSMLNQYPRNSLKQSFFLSFPLRDYQFVCFETLLSKIQRASLFHGLRLFSEFCQKSGYPLYHSV